MTSATKVKRSMDKISKRIPSTTRGQWQHVAFRVRHTPDYLIEGTDHLELLVLRPKREPLPITDTGYLSHFVDGRDVPNAVVALAFFLKWIGREARSKRWQTADNKRRQLDLFAQS